MPPKKSSSKRRTTKKTGHTHAVRSVHHNGATVNLYIDRETGFPTHVQEQPSVPVVNELPPPPTPAQGAPGGDAPVQGAPGDDKKADQKDDKSPADKQKEKDEHHHKWTFRLVLFGFLLIAGILAGTYLSGVGGRANEVPPVVPGPAPGPDPEEDPEEDTDGAPRWVKIGSWLMLFGIVCLFLYMAVHKTKVLAEIKVSAEIEKRARNTEEGAEAAVRYFDHNIGRWVEEVN